MLTTVSLRAQDRQPGPKQPTGPAADKPPAAQPAGPELPGFSPPRAIPEIMRISKPLLTAAEEREYLRSADGRGFASALRTGKRSRSADQMIRKGVRYRLYKMTMKKNQGALHKIREELLRDLKGAGLLEKKLEAKVSFREFVVQEVTARAEELLDNNFHVRLQAVIVLAQLNLLEEDRRNKQPAVAFTPAAEVLLKVVVDKDQPQAMKIQAVKGLKRIALLGRPDNDLKFRIADNLVEQLTDENLHYWYQMRLAEALGAIDLFLHRNTQTPFIVDALSKVVVDRKRHWIVRCQAARSLGRAHLVPQGTGGRAGGKVNVRLIAYQIADLGRQMADGYNKNPRAFYWKDCYFKLYLAFQPLDDGEKRRHAGLLMRMEQIKDPRFAADKQLVKDAYQAVVLPLARDVLKPNAPARLPKEMLNEIDEWLLKKKPPNVRIWPGLDPLISESQPVISS